MKRIAIIGANEQQNPLILKAHEMGFETHVFSWQTEDCTGEKSADCFYPISAGSKEEILEKVKNIGACAIVSIGSDIAALSSAYVAENLGFVSNTYSSVVCSTNKILTRTLFSKSEIPQPKFVEIGDSIPLETLGKLHYPLVIKASDRSGGRGLSKIEDVSQLYTAISKAREMSFERKAIAEEYIEGQLYSCECISSGGNHKILGYTKRTVLEVGTGIYEKSHFQPANIPMSLSEKMEKLSVRVLNTLGLREGASSIEFIVDAENNVFVIEVTPTMYGDFIGTNLVPEAYGYDYLKMVIDVALGNVPDLLCKDPGQTVCVNFYYSKVDGNDKAPEIPDGSRYGHEIIKKKIKEYGGCAPLKICETGTYYKENECVLACSSEYAAFRCALEHLAPKCVHIPYYVSPSWERIVSEYGIECKYYRIGDDLLPVGLDVSDDEAVLLVNYHGLCHDFIKESKFTNKIIDNSMAFFAEPIMENGTYNIYSCRKFFAVPDGGYLVSQSLKENPIIMERDISYKRARAQLLALELGESAAYKEQQANEQEIFRTKRRMSVLTEKLLSCVDYEDEKIKRKSNFDLLHSKLSVFNLLPFNLELDIVPQFYPLLVNSDIRRALVNKKIYVPVMWRKLISDEYDGFTEKNLAEKLLCLPIEPRYSAEDMEYMADYIKSLLS